MAVIEISIIAGIVSSLFRSYQLKDKARKLRSREPLLITKGDTNGQD
jgi:hypothetical protein